MFPPFIPSRQIERLVEMDYYPELRNHNWDRRQKRQMSDVGLRLVGEGSVLGSARQGLGLLLIRAGRRLQGLPGDLGARPGLNADAATQ